MSYNNNLLYSSPLYYCVNWWLLYAKLSPSTLKGKIMTRRDMIKLSSVMALSTVTATAYDEKLIVNEIKMQPKDSKKMTKGEQKHTPKD